MESDFRTFYMAVGRMHTKLPEDGTNAHRADTVMGDRHDFEYSGIGSNAHRYYDTLSIVLW